MLKSFPLLTFICVFLFSEIGTSVAALPDNILSDYSIRRWRGEDGLSDDIVNGVDQSADGYLWCVTRNQIMRFDGLRFTPMDRSQWPDVPFSWRGVYVDRKGVLWIYGAGGILKYDGREWRAFTKMDKFTPLIVCFMEEDANGVIWGACEQGMFKFDGSKPVLFPCSREGTPFSITAMDVGTDGQIWVVAKNLKGTQLFRFCDGVYHEEYIPVQDQGDDILKVHSGPSGSLWVATTKHLLCKSEGFWRDIAFPEDQSDWSGIRTILERPGGELWMGTVRGLFRLRDEKWSELTTREGIFPFAVRFLKEDRDGGVWAAGTGGLMRLTPKALHTFHSGLGLEKESYISLSCAGNQWWVGIPGMGPFLGYPGSFKSANLDAFPENTTASALLKTRDGALWVGTHARNLWRWKDGKSEIILPKGSPDSPSNGVTALLEDRGGKIWVGTLGGLSVVAPEGLTPVRVWGWCPVDTVNTLYEDHDGTVWVGYQTLGLAKILRDGSSVQYQKGTGLPDNSVRVVFRDSSGVLWIGTSAGLVRWMKNRQDVFTTAQGLGDDGIRQIIEDHFGYLWIGTRFGLIRVNRSEFSEVAAGIKPTMLVQYFGHDDGMQSEECTYAQPVKTADGKLWFPTTNGLVMADAGALPRMRDAAPAYVEEIRVKGESIWSLNPVAVSLGKTHPEVIVLPAGARQIEFRFTATDYSVPEKVRFKYRIEGLNEEWSTPTIERSALFPKMAPGTYRFRVLSCSGEGVWSEKGGYIAFNLPPLFWQTRGFEGGAAVVVLAGVGLSVTWLERRRARKKLLKLENEQAVERERARIARDIHDEVGAGLTEVALLSELAQAQADDHGSEQNYLDDIFKTARDLTRSLDEIVWAINPSNDTLEKLVSYLVEFASDFLGNAAIFCRLDVPTALPTITVAANMRHQTCLAVKEILNNTVKHAAATEVRMTIAWTQEVLQIVIEDNGCGFIRDVTTNISATSNGLTNIENRMREIGGHCEQQSRIGEGTRTVLSVEIPTIHKPKKG